VKSARATTAWSAFLPRTRSKTVFVLVAACYAYTAGALAQALCSVFGISYAPVDPRSGGSLAFYVLDDLVFAPVLESLILIATIELLRWFRFPVSLQVICSALVSAALHVSVSPWLPFVVFPAWLIMASVYLVWRRASWRAGFIVVVSIHALLNLIPVIRDLGYVVRNT
jgi:hypothetical protein